MMAIGLETAKQGIGKINVIAVVSGVISKETVKTVQNPPAGVSDLFQDHLLDHCHVVVGEAVVQVTTAEVAATVDPDHQGRMAVAPFRMKGDQEVEVTATALRGQGDKVQKWRGQGDKVQKWRGQGDKVQIWTLVGAAVFQLTM